MFLQTSHKPARITATAGKSRLNTQNRKIDNISETRRRSPDGYPGPPSPASCNDVMVFTNSHGHGRSGYNSRNPPEYPCIDEMQRYIQDVWDQKMRELNDPNSKLKYLNLSTPKDKNSRKEGSPPSSQPSTPVKQRNSPVQSIKRF